MPEFQITGGVSIDYVRPGVVFPITGSVTAAPPNYIGTIGTILTPVAISGSIVTTPPAYIGTVNQISTILNAPLVTVQGMVTVPLVMAVATVGTVVAPVAVGTVLSPVVVTGTVSTGPQAAIGTVGTVQSQANLAVASLVGSISSPIAVGGGTVGTLQSLANVAVASLVGSIGSPVTVATLQSPVGNNLLGGTVGTLLSLANVAVASLVGSIGSPVVVGGGTIGTLQSLANVAVASLVGSIGSPVVLGGGTVGTLQSLANLAVASLVGSIGSPVVLGGGTVGTIQSGVVSATIIGGNIPVVGTVGTVESLANLAVASLVGSIGSPVILGGGTVGTILSPIIEEAWHTIGGTGTIQYYGAGPGQNSAAPSAGTVTRALYATLGQRLYYSMALAGTVNLPPAGIWMDVRCASQALPVVYCQLGQAVWGVFDVPVAGTYYLDLVNNSALGTVYYSGAGWVTSP